MYYSGVMMKQPVKDIDNYVQRDCIHLNNCRGTLCADVACDPKWNAIADLLHNSTLVHQVNSVPEKAVCFIDKKLIPTSSAGIQLVLHMDREKKHICVRKQYQNKCYAYFIIRHFPEIIKRIIKTWLQQQEFYLPHVYTYEEIIKKLLSSHLPQLIFTRFNEMSLFLTDVTKADLDDSV